MLDTDTEETLVKKLTIKVMKLSITDHNHSATWLAPIHLPFIQGKKILEIILIIWTIEVLLLVAQLD